MDLITIPSFLVVLGIIIFVHEFGHFITAKAFGMRVFIFSFGFGKRLAGFQWGDTDCRLSLIPLGGYVKLEGEPEDHLSEDTSTRGDRKDFTARPRWQRFIVYLAGPFMNAVLTIAILTVFHMVGFGLDASIFDRPILGVIEAGTPAAAAGLKTGDEILSIDGEAPDSWQKAREAILLRPDRDLRMRVRQGAQEREVVVRSGHTAERYGTIGNPTKEDPFAGVYPLVRVGDLVKDNPAEAAGLRKDDAIVAIGATPIRSFMDIIPVVQGAKDRPLEFQLYRNGTIEKLVITPKDGLVGIKPKVVIKKFGPAGAAREAVAYTWSMTKTTVNVIKRLLTAQISPKTMMGPIGIARASGDAARDGGIAWFNLIAMISLQVGLLNLFPLAPLDGGHLAILGLEGLIRRDFSADVKAWIMNAGALLIFALIGLVLYSDLSKTSLLGRFLP
jgi:regulator of sigma E protease